MKPPIHVLAFVPNLLGSIPGQRSSIESWLPYLNEEGIEVQFVPFETSELREVLYTYGNTSAKSRRMIRAYFQHVLNVWRNHRADLIYIYREMALIGPGLLEFAISRTRQPIIYSLDDPIFVPSRSPFQGWFSKLKFPSKIRRIVGRSDVVLANSRPIAAWARQYCHRVFLIPSGVDTNHLVPSANHARQSPPVIGWSGSTSTSLNLSLAARALDQVQARTGATIRVVGGSDYPLLPTTQYEELSWSSESELTTIGSFDIGLAPMPDNAWNYWKFSGKVTYYMSLGIPTVATPIGDIPNQLRHGVDGFLADSEMDWIHHLTTLIQDPEMRFQMGVEARQSAERQFALDVIGPRVAKIMRATSRDRN